MSGDRSLTVKILGDAAGGKKALQEVEQAGGKTDGAVGLLSGHFAALGTAIVGGLSVGAVVDFGKKSVDAFSEVASETLKLQRLTGDTAQNMSRLQFAAEETGTSMDTLETGIKKMSKSAEATKSPITEMGVAVQDAHGKFRPMNDVLLDIAGKFKTMPDGIEKNALAMKIFGKSGTDMLPFLARGKEGLADLEKESDKFGLTIGQGQVDAVRKATLAHREFSSAMKGLEVQVGGALYPVIAKLTGFIAESVVPVLLSVGKVVSKDIGAALTWLSGEIHNLAPVFGVVKEAIEDIITGFTDFTTSTDIASGHFGGFATTFLTIGQTLHQVFDGIKSVVLDLVHGAESLYSSLQPVFSAIGNFVGSNPGPVLAAFGAIVLAVLVPAFVSWAIAAGSAAIATIAAAAPVIAIVAGIGLLVGALVYAYNHWTGFREVIQTVVHFITGSLIPTLGDIWHTVSQVFGQVVQVIQTAWAAIKPVFDVIVTVVKTYLEAEFTVLSTIVKTAWEIISTVITTAWGIIKPIVSFFIDLLKTGLENEFHLIQGVVEAVWPVVSGAISTAWGIIKPILNFLVDNIRNGVIQAFNDVKIIGGAVWDTFTGAVQTMWNIVSAPLKELLNIIHDILNAAGSIGGAISSGLSHIPGAGIVKGLLGHAAGTNNSAGGLRLVGERGPEIVSLPSGSAVTSNEALSRGSAGAGVHIHLHVEGATLIGDDLTHVAEKLVDPLRVAMADVSSRNGYFLGSAA